MRGARDGHARAVLQAGAGGARRQAGAGAGRGAVRARAHRHLRPHGAPAARAHGLVRYYEPEVNVIDRRLFYCITYFSM